jgi:hypothetical protein
MPRIREMGPKVQRFDLSDGDASTGSIVGQSPWLTIVQHNGTGGTRALAIPVSFSQ